MVQIWTLSTYDILDPTIQQGFWRFALSAGSLTHFWVWREKNCNHRNTAELIYNAEDGMFLCQSRMKYTSMGHKAKIHNLSAISASKSAPKQNNISHHFICAVYELHLSNQKVLNQPTRDLKFSLAPWLNRALMTWLQPPPPPHTPPHPTPHPWHLWPRWLH